MEANLSNFEKKFIKVLDAICAIIPALFLVVVSFIFVCGFIIAIVEGRWIATFILGSIIALFIKAAIR